MATIQDVIAELKNYELNGSDPVKQIRGIYSDLESATTLFVRYKKALEELVGFAKRNEERAMKAALAANAGQALIEAQARHHEAVRVRQVITMRVGEALHAR